MVTDIGEYLVGAYLKLIENCDVVDYNVRSPEGGVKGMGELDVIGLRFTDQTAILCEVATHLGGLEYGQGYSDSEDRVRKKHARQREYAEKYLGSFDQHRYEFWAPRVPRGRLLQGLETIDGLNLVVNHEYTDRVDQLVTLAGESTRDRGNPVFRVFQILAALRR